MRARSHSHSHGSKHPRAPAEPAEPAEPPLLGAERYNCRDHDSDDEDDSSDDNAADDAAPAHPLLLAPARLYRRCHDMRAMIAALEAEKATLQMLLEDGWRADAWNTEEFIALRPGAGSAWRVAPGGGGARGADGRVTLQRARPEGGWDMHEGPVDPSTPWR